MKRLEAATATSRVEYCWDSTATSVRITVVNASGNVEQVDNRKPNQCYSPGKFRGGQPVSLSVQSNDDTSTTVTCEIKIGGTVAETATSSGTYTVALCAGAA